MKKFVWIFLALAALAINSLAGVTPEYAAWKAAQVSTPQADLQYVLNAKAAGTLDNNDPVYLRVLAQARASGMRASSNPLDQGNDACPATVVPGVPYNDTGTTCGYLDDYQTCYNTAPDVIYEFTPTVTTLYHVSLCAGTSYDSKLEVRSGGLCPGSFQECCNDDYCGLQSQCDVILTASVTYYIIVDGYSSYCGNYVLDIWQDAPPPVGRCCYSGTQCVDNVTQAYCDGLFGTWTEGETCANACPLPPGGPLCNALVCVQMDGDGDFNIGTPDNRSLLYYYPSSPWSTDIRVLVDGLVYNLDSPGNGCNGSATFISQSNDGVSLTANYTLLGFLAIQVTHTPVMFTGTTGAILTRVVVTNLDGTHHEIGILYEYDTTVDGDDAAELYLGPNHLPNETCYDAPFPYPYWEAIPQSGTLVGRGTFTGGAAVTPDHLAFGQWVSFYGTCWNYTCSGQPYGDSAVLYWWDPQIVPPGGTRVAATYYGVGELQIQPGDLQLSVVQPNLQCIAGQVVPDPFQILVNVTNTGGSTCHNVTVTLAGGNGPGGTSTILPPNPQSIASLAPGNNAAFSFAVDLTSNNPAGGCLFFDIIVTSDNCPPNQILDYCVYVPPCMNCYFHSEESDMGDLPACNYPTLCSNPSHELTGVAWLGEWINGEPCPNYINLDPFDDGVFFLNPPWTPCSMEAVQVTVTAGPNYGHYVECGGHLYLSAWKDGNVDGDFCDILCDGFAPEWIIQDVPVGPGTFIFTFPDPGIHAPSYDGIFRFRLMSGPHGPFGCGLMVPDCPEMPCGTFDHDSIGEVEDYIIDRLQPVELAAFTASAGDGEVTFNWSTASETSNDHFEVMRDGVFLASILGAGNSSTAREYNWTDTRVVNGTTYNYTLVGVDASGAREDLRTASVTPSINAAQVSEYALRQNYPNPFNPSTSVVYDMKEAGFVTIKVYNLLGQEVSVLVNGQAPQGRHTVAFSATDLPSGVYVCKMETGGFIAQNKMLLMK
jgi:hypothetical protein